MRCRYFLWWLIHGFVAFLLIAGCQTNLEQESKRDSEELPDQEGWNSTIVFSNLGKPSSTIKYHYMQVFSDKSLIKFLAGVEIQLFDEDGEKRTEIQSDDAILNEVNNEIKLSGNVSVITADSIRLYSEELIWNDDNDEIISEMPVTFITTEQDTIYGEGFESDSSLRNWEITKPTGTSEQKIKVKRDE